MAESDFKAVKISSGVTKRIFQGNEIQFLEECEPSPDAKDAFGKHDQYGDSDTDFSQGKEDSRPTSHFTLRESAIEATLEKIINNQRRADKKFLIFSDEVKSDIRDVRHLWKLLERKASYMLMSL